MDNVQVLKEQIRELEKLLNLKNAIIIELEAAMAKTIKFSKPACKDCVCKETV